MAPPRRKRKTTTAQANKRQKKAPASSEEKWAAKGILAEKKLSDGKVKYLVDWEGFDPKTGQAYTPGWEPRANCTKALIADWEEKKKEAARAKSPTRCFRVVESSPLVPSSAFTAPAPRAQPRESPRVQISWRKSSHPDDYRYYSQLPATPTSVASTRQSLPSCQSSYTGPRHYRSSGIVYDSEDEDGADEAASYIPTTQDVSSSTSTATQQPSSASYSCLTLSTPLEERDPGPSTDSIPETEPDVVEHGTIEDSQTQSQPLLLPPSPSPSQTEGLREIPDTFDSIVSTSQPAPHEVGGRSEQPVVEEGLGVAITEDDPPKAQQEIEIAEQTTLLGLNAEPLHSATQPETEQQVAVAEPLIAASLTEGEPAKSSPQPFPQQELRNSEEQPAVVEQGELELELRPAQTSVSEHSRVSGHQSSTQPTALQQHAQHIPTDTYLSTQDGVTESIRTTIENSETVAHRQASPQSRHDSSLESPEPCISSALVSSRLPPLPSQSLGAPGPNVPARARTPAHSSPFSSIMEDDPERFQREIDELIARKQAENPFTPRRTLKRSRMFPSAGTRSPSTIPDRSPMPQVPTSLRTIAISNSVVEAPVASEAGPSETAPWQEEGDSRTSDDNNDVAVPVPAVPAMPTSTGDELSDADDVSLLNDDLQLQPLEYVIPLPIEGRQAGMYRDEIKNNQDILKAFINNPEGFDQMEKIERVLQRLRSIETHIDLIFSASQPSQDIGSSPQLQYQAQWSYDNSIKFRFIGTLLHKLQDYNMHVLLVLEDEDARLFDIVETFLKGRFIHFRSPTRSHQADLARVEGNLVVTVLPKKSSPIVRPADLIICLDGHADAEEIRKKNWAANPTYDQAIVPLLHLVIPRTVDHIARYASLALNNRRRAHTILATLAQLHLQGEIGRPMSHTPKTNEAADEVIRFLRLREGESPIEWPLPSIGSIKDVVEFQSQQSIASTPRGSSVAKRPLEDETLDPAKRMRFTPQPGEPTSSVNNEVTHISDSMPGTAVEVAKLQQQLAEARQEVSQERIERLRLQEYQESFSKQQTAHEDRAKSYVKMKNENERLKRERDAGKAREDTLRERLETITTDYRNLQASFNALQNTLLLSEEGKIAEIALLRKELAEAKENEQRAVKSRKSSDESLEYLKEQYRNAQDANATLSQQVDEDNTIIVGLEKKASGEAAKLAQIHYDRQEKLKNEHKAKCCVELRIVKQQYATVTEENLRLKNGRGVGVGTRAQTPRPGSRAASPLPAGYRDRLANLRNG